MVNDVDVTFAEVPLVNSGQMALCKLRRKNSVERLPRPYFKNAHRVRTIKDFGEGKTPLHDIPVIHIEVYCIELVLRRVLLKSFTN